MSARRHFIVPLLLLLFGFSAVSAQPNVEANVEKLEQTIRVLERRIEVLEEQLRQKSSLPVAAPDRMSWRRLQRGMSENEVEKLIGSPARIDAMGAFTFWHYGGNGGQVTFDGRTRTVYAWSEPRDAPQMPLKKHHPSS